MSRNALIILAVLCIGIAGLIIYPKIRSGKGDISTPPDTANAGTGNSGTSVSQPQPNTVQPIANNSKGSQTPTTVSPGVNPSAASNAGTATLQTGLVARAPIGNPAIVPMNDAPDTKPLPVLEKNYLATTNRDDRLDLMMDITDWPGPETVRTLTRLFQQETDPELKVDLLDSLLGIEGQVDEKLALLTLGAGKQNPIDVRQSAIDGLIDLDDPRAIPILNGMLNDPEEEIRESAKDALEMLQSQPAVKLTPTGGKAVSN